MQRTSSPTRAQGPTAPTVAAPTERAAEPSSQPGAPSPAGMAPSSIAQPAQPQRCARLVPVPGGFHHYSHNGGSFTAIPHVPADYFSVVGVLPIAPPAPAPASASAPLSASASASSSASASAQEQASVRVQVQKEAPSGRGEQVRQDPGATRPEQVTRKRPRESDSVAPGLHCDDLMGRDCGLFEFLVAIQVEQGRTRAAAAAGAAGAAGGAAAAAGAGGGGAEAGGEAGEAGAGAASTAPAHG